MIKRQNPKHKHITSFQIIILGFLSVIILGSILLMLPVATRDDFQNSLETTSLLKELDAKKIGFPCGTGSTRKISSAKRCG